jgi:hypothetical protein
MPSIPLGGDALCINKEELIFAYAGPLIRFVFLNNVMSTLPSLRSQL